MPDVTVRTGVRVDCPHPECAVSLVVPDGTPDGVYACRCGACRVRVAWDTYLNRGRVPRLTLEEETDG